MADNTSEYKIRLTTEADTSGAEAIDAELKKVQADADAANAAANGGGGASVPRSAADVSYNADLTARANAATQQAEAEAIVSAEEQKQIALLEQKRILAAEIVEQAELEAAQNSQEAVALAQQIEIRRLSIQLQTQLNISEAEAFEMASRRVQAEALVNETKTAQEALNAELVAQEAAMAEASAIPGIQLGKARAEAITLARELATGSVNARTVGALIGSLGPSLTIGALAGYEVYKAITGIAEEQLKVNQEIDNQTDKLVANAKTWGEMAKNATSPEDVQKLAADISKSLDQVAQKTREVQQEGLHGWDAFLDNTVNVLTKIGSLGRDSFHPYLEAQDQAIENQKALQDTAIMNARLFIQQSQKAAEEWKTQLSGSLDEAIEHYQSKIDDLYIAQEKLNLSMPGAVQQFANYGIKIQDASKKLEDLKTKHDNLTEGLSKLDESLKKINFDRLDAKGKLLSLKNDLDDVSKKLIKLGIDAAAPQKSLEANTVLVGVQKKEAGDLVLRYEKITDEIRKQNSEIIKGVMAKRAADDEFSADKKTVDKLNAEIAAAKKKLQIDQSSHAENQQINADAEQIKTLTNQRDAAESKVSDTIKKRVEQSIKDHATEVAQIEDIQKRLKALDKSPDLNITPGQMRPDLLALQQVLLNKITPQGVDQSKVTDALGKLGPDLQNALQPTDQAVKAAGDATASAVKGVGQSAQDGFDKIANAAQPVPQEVNTSAQNVVTAIGNMQAAVLGAFDAMRTALESIDSKLSKRIENLEQYVYTYL